MDIIQIITLGVCVGVISSTLGLGGGVLIVPLLPLITPLNQKETIATSLLTIFIVVSVNTLFFHRKKLVSWPVVLMVGPLSGIFSFTAGKLSMQLPDSALKFILSGLVLFFGFKVLLQKNESVQLSQDQLQKSIMRSWKKLSLLGMVSGFASGISGIGSGLIMSPSLLHFKVVDNQRVTPTSNGIMVHTTLFGALAFALNSSVLQASANVYQVGFIRTDLVLTLASTALIAAYFGRGFQHRIGPHLRRYILSALLLLFGVKEFFFALMEF